MLIIFTLSTSICIFVVPFIMQSYPLVTIVISQVGKLMISGAVLVSWIYVPELFPTSMRGLANGVFVFVGRGGAILAPIVDTAVGDKYIKITFYGYTVVGLVMIGLVFLLPETRNRSFHHGEEDDDEEEEQLAEEDRRALRASDEYFRNGGQGLPFEQVVADLGFTMEQIRGAKKQQ